MDPDVAYRKALQVVMAILIFTFIPSILPAQKKNNNSGNSSKPAAAPAQKPAAPAQKTSPQHQPAQPQRPGQAGNQGNKNGSGSGTGTGRGVGNNKDTGPATGQGGGAGRGTGTATGHGNGGAAPPTKQPATVHNPNGSVTKTNPNGSSVTRGGNGKPSSVTTASGAKANYSPSGKVSSIHTSVTDKNPAHSGEMNITKGAHNQRMTVTKRNDGSRLVSTGAHRGFVEHSFVRNGHPYMRRTYVVNGRSYAAVYRGYPYRGVVYYGYVPAYYYGPAYYGWAYDPWTAPVPYAWGWGGAPWYGYYGAYFSPYPAYADASLWLTDYLLAENLQAAYQARVDGNGGTAPAPSSDDQSGDANSAPAAQTATAMSPETKQAIDEDVKAQLAAEKADASGGASTVTTGDQIPAALDPNHRTFIVSAQLQEQLDGATCTLSAGDVLTRIDNAPDANQNVKVLVTSNQKGDCQSGAQVAVSVQDLQDMHNDFAAKIDAGLQKLADTQGKNGIPAGPAAGGQKNPDGTANADLTAAADLQQQQEAADQTETEVKQAEAGQGN
ncbi:MAG: hypothetical protein WB995_07750 [Candidatus Acidiferrales bacterium]